jgi:hypothetical protein
LAQYFFTPTKNVAPVSVGLRKTDSTFFR